MPIYEGSMDFLKTHSGKDGESTYVHIRYSDVENPEVSDMTTYPTTYIGIYTGPSKIAPNDPNQYQWTRWQGKDGSGKPGADGRTPNVIIKFSDDGGKTFTGNDGEVPGAYMGVLVTFDRPEDIPPIPDIYKPWIQVRGADGVTTYTWMKFADDATGSGMSDDPEGKSYIGFAYNKEEIQESDNPEDYTWALIRGKDGTNRYMWTMYADDINGSNMSISPEGKDYIGLAFNKELPQEDDPASNSPASYTWKKLRGDQGEPGISSRLHIKYSDDGGLTFTENNGETIGKWIGIYVDTKEESSLNVNDYTWKKYVGEDGLGYTVVLSNENHGFVADGKEIVQAERIEILVSAFLGKEKKAATVTIPEGLPEGMTVTIKEGTNGTLAPVIIVSVDDTLTAKQGSIDFSILVDDLDFLKVFSWNVNTGGTDGVPGRSYAIDATTSSVIYNLKNASCSPTDVSFSSFYFDGDEAERHPLACWTQLEYSTDGVTWIAYGDRAYTETGIRRFSFYNPTLSPDGLPVTTEGSITKHVRCMIYASEASPEHYAQSMIAVILNTDEVAVLTHVDENNVVYIDGGRIFARSVTAKQLAADVLKSNNYKESTDGIYATEGTFIDFLAGTITSKNFAILDTGAAYFKGEIITPYGYLGSEGFKLGDKFLYNSETGNLELTGDIVANSLTLASGATIDSENVSGLDEKVQYYVDESGAIIRGETVGSTPSEYSTGFTVSRNGLLQASNAVIYGTIYAKAGEFTGTVDASYIKARESYHIYDTEYNELVKVIDYAPEEEDSSWNLLRFGILSDTPALNPYIEFSRSFNYYVTGIYAPDEIAIGGRLTVAVSNRNGSPGVYAKGGLYSDGVQVSVNGHTHSQYSRPDTLYYGDTKVASTFYSSSTGNYGINPNKDEVYPCGSKNARWKAVWATKGTIETSDINEKENIQDIDERYEKMFMDLHPVNYMWRNFNNSGNHDRIHSGLIAQEVNEAAERNGLSSELVGAIHWDVLDEPTADGRTERWGLNYKEFIPLLIHMLQKSYKKIEELENRVNNLGD